jgi:glycosyltransferase involved in cell wall biosynthesis
MTALTRRSKHRPGGRRRTRASGRPKITVVIPVWDDYAGVVEDAIATVCAQEEPAEVVVVDNASSTALPSFDGPVTALRLPQRRSVGAARNAGLELVRTKFVLFLDADDVIEQDTLSLLLSRLEDDPRLVACSCGVVAWNAATGRTQKLPFPSRLTRIVARWPGAYRFYAALDNRMPTTGCVLMRTEAVRTAGGFSDADFAEDWPLNVTLAFRGPIAFVVRPGRMLRVHASSLRASPRSRAQVSRSFDLVLERVRNDRATPPLVRAVLPLLALRYAWSVRRLTPRGSTVPGPAFRAVGDSGPLRPARHAVVTATEVREP